MGLFGSKKKQAKEVQQREAAEIKAKEEARKDRSNMAALFEGEHILICGSAFMNMMVRDFISGAKNVETFTSIEQESILSKCVELKPTILILTNGYTDLLEFAGKIVQKCPKIMIIASSKESEKIPYTETELREAHVFAVLSKPYVKEESLAVIRDMMKKK